MAQYKTFELNGTEQEVTIAGRNCDIRNDGIDTIYISKNTPVVCDNDGVLSVPVGCAAKLLDCDGVIHLLGTGKVLLCGNDYTELVFKCAPSGGGTGTVDSEARNTIGELAQTVTQNTNRISELASDIQITETTLNSISNPNILRNPDFGINQRGNATYYGAVYSVDCWQGSNPKVEINVADYKINVNQTIVGTTPMLIQRISLNDIDLRGRTITFSAKISQLSGIAGMRMIIDDYSGSTIHRTLARIDVTKNGVHSITTMIPEECENCVTVCFADHDTSNTVSFIPEWAKLEISPYATPYIPYERANELLRCQHYYQIHSTGNIDPIDLRPNMAKNIEIKLRKDGAYAYIASI